ncbi:MAG: M20 family metallopeptidase [Thaumarchaeota archaeon]|nr:M20 family metallopeptidase [Nitrososphaerota archaeon]
MEPKEFSRMLLADLVAINSVNPGTSSESKGEFEISEFIRETLSKLGFVVETQEVESRRQNVIAKLRFSRKTKSSRSLMFNCHMDTVPVTGMSIDPLKPVVKNGFLYGRGSADTKGGIAATITSGAQLLEEDPKDQVGELLLTFVVGEEYLSEGTAKLVEKYTADAAIVCEPTDLSLGLAHKGITRFLVEIFGKPAHGGVPELGVDAIEKAGKLAVSLNGDLRTSLQRKKHRLAGSPTIHNSIIEGGSLAWNVVPDYCKLGVERRTIPGESAESLVRELKSQIEKIRSFESDDAQRSFRYKISKTFERLPLETKATELIAQTLLTATSQVLGDTKIAGMPFWTDAAFLSQRGGIPSVVIGPGRVDEAHTKDEKVELAKVYCSVDIFKKTIENFLS